MGLFGKKKAETAVSESGAGVYAANGAAKAASGAEGGELIAVIAAAISAYEAEQFSMTLYVRKINRVCGTRPVWGVMGTLEVIDTRRM